MVPATRPGVLSLWLAIQVGVDRKATSGHVRILAPDFDKVIPFDIPEGWAMADLSTPFVAPVFRNGRLRVSIVDDRKPGSPFVATWGIAFDPDSPRLEETLVQDAERVGDAAVASLVSTLARRRGPPH